MFGFGKKPEEGKNVGFVPAGGDVSLPPDVELPALARKEGSENYPVMWRESLARILNKKCNVPIDAARLLAEGFGQDRIFTSEEKETLNTTLLGDQVLKDFSRETIYSFARSLMLAHAVPDEVTGVFLDVGEDDAARAEKWEGDPGEKVRKYLAGLE